MPCSAQNAPPESAALAPELLPEKRPFAGALMEKRETRGQNLPLWARYFGHSGETFRLNISAFGLDILGLDGPGQPWIALDAMVSIALGNECMKAAPPG